VIRPGAGVRAAALVGAAALLFAVVHFAGRPLQLGDVFLHVRAGAMVLDHQGIPDSDTFTYTVAGTPWNNHEWGWETLAALLYRIGGWGAFRLVLALGCCALVAALLVGLARRVGAAVALLIATLFVVLASYKFIPAPQTLSMALLLASLAVFRGPTLLERRWHVAGLALLMLIWGNLTAEALLFLPFLLVDQAQAILAKGLSPVERRRRVLLLLLICVAPLLTPSASSILDYVLEGTAVNRQVNPEFRRLWEPAGTVAPIAKQLARALAVAFALFAAVKIARARDKRTELHKWSTGLVALWAAASAERYLFLLVVPMARVALELAERRRTLVDAGAFVLACAVFAGFAHQIGWTFRLAATHFGSAAWWHGHLDERSLPVACMDELERAPPGTRVFADRGWGSFVAFAAPNVKTFIDGRNREFPLDLHRGAYEVVHGGPRARGVLDVTRTQLVLAPPGWDRLPGLRGSSWRPLFSAPGCAIYARAEE
jgi:hypothetical protein